MRAKKFTSVVAVAAVLAASACSSSGGKSGTAGGGKTLRVGLLTDATGLASSASKTAIQGVEAGASLARQAGYSVSVSTGDTTTLPGGALTAAQKLVQQDHVDVVIAVSAVAFGGAQFLNKANIPVVGVAEDGPEWISDTNMFSTYGELDVTKVSTLFGKFMKMEGVTTVGAVGYGISPSSADAAKGDAASAQAVGLKVGYLNANFPFGSTDVGPEAIAMKNNGVDGMTATVDPNTGFALITSLRQNGDPLKVALLPTGYGGDLEQAGPGAFQSAQNVYFQSTFEPVEMNTPATPKFQAALRAVGVTGDPTYAEYAGYTSMGLILAALQADGGKTDRASLLSALRGIHSYDALGLLGSGPDDPNQRPYNGVSCTYTTKLSGTTFELVPGADPVCGTYTGQKVS